MMGMGLENWISVSLPKDCPNVCISFKREIADIQIKQFEARPLYGFGNEKEEWLPIEVFITYGEVLAGNMDAGKEVEKVKIREEVRETLKKQLEKLSKHFSETEDIVK